MKHWKKALACTMSALVLTGALAFSPAKTEVHAEGEKEAYKAALEQYNLGSIGYFKTHTTDYARVEQIFNSAKDNYGQQALMPAYADGVWKTGDESDAISLVNMKKSLELIKEMNDLRASDNNNGDKTALKVTDALMATAQVITDQSAAQSTHGNIGHWVPTEIFRLAGNPSENAAWGYADPFTGWYTAEKKNYDAGKRDGTDVGHYTNIIGSHTAAGLAYANKGSFGSTSILELGTPSQGTQYDFNTYYNNFMSYYNQVRNNLDAAFANYAEPMYRLYNPNSGEHFYTAVATEKNHLVSLGWRDEGTGWYAPKTGKEVYRLYNRFAGEHHYTLSKEERDGLVKLGWRYEGVGWYSDEDEAVPVYRQYNKNAYANNHNYTASAQEKDWLISLGWKDEGIGWYALRAGK